MPCQGHPRGGLRLADVVRETGLGKTTAHRILGGLVATGLAEQDEETGRFFVGLKMLTWASAAKNRFSFARLAEPTLSRISQRTQDTIYLIMRDGDEIVCPRLPRRLLPDPGPDPEYRRPAPARYRRRQPRDPGGIAG